MYFIHAKYVVVLIISRARIFRSENKMSEKKIIQQKKSTNKKGERNLTS